MKQVYKCDFCHETNEDSKKMEDHEPTCSFNPAAKKCYSCQHEVNTGGYYEDWYDCSIGLSHYGCISSGGNCPGWEQKIKE